MAGVRRAPPAGCLCSLTPGAGHAQADGSSAGRELAHGFQFLHGGGQGGLDRGDLAEPALFPGLLEPGAQVGVDLFQPWYLSWVNPKERAPDASVFVCTWRSIVTAADAERDFPELEMGQKLVPFANGEITVFFAGPLGPAAR